MSTVDARFGAEGDATFAGAGGGKSAVDDSGMVGGTTFDGVFGGGIAFASANILPADECSKVLTSAANAAF